MNPALVVSLFCAAFCLFGFIYIKWYIKRRTSAKELLGEYSKEVYRLNAQIDATTDRDMRLIEERISVLKSLLEDTDKRISVYIRELERSRHSEAAYGSLGRSARLAAVQVDAALAGQAALDGQAAPAQPSAQTPPAETLPAQPPVQTPPAESSVEPAPSGRRKKPAAEKSSGAEAVAKAGRRKKPSVETPADDAASAHLTEAQARDEIIRMSQAGLPPGEIALRLNLRRSEVDLILNLPGKR
ncbi:MAG: hypothetical protein FWG66_14225 [Spirochaetes bacterium]|nr:hypothetical protein [Spirochaetota bacterium]